MTVGLGISGMGRIGRLLVRKMLSDGTSQIELKAINSVYPAETVAHLLKYDTVHGTWDAAISVHDGMLVINGHPVKITYQREPENIEWGQMDVDVVIDATGQFNHRQGAQKHLKTGASTVIVTAPGTQMDLIVVMGNQIKLLAWYDNEWAYASRVIELAQTVSERMGQKWQTSLAL